MTPARLRRLSADYEEIKRHFAGHKYILVTTSGDDPPEKYHVIYMVNGIYMFPDGTIGRRERHEVEITLHADYPRYKPLCSISTPIWHPNFRDGQICIGDIWGAGESLSDIIVNIGDMIQYKSWNAYSPLSSEAARWAMENRQLFPVGNLDLGYSDGSAETNEVEIELLNDEEPNVSPKKLDTDTEADASVDVSATETNSEADMAVKIKIDPESASLGTESEYVPHAAEPQPGYLSKENVDIPAMEVEPDLKSGDINDFEISAEDLAGITFIPTAQRMQGTPCEKLVQERKVNFKTILVKGLLWALLGAFVGFGFAELSRDYKVATSISRLSGYTYLADYFDYTGKSNSAMRDNNLENALDFWIKAGDAYRESLEKDFKGSDTKRSRAISSIVRTGSAVWSCIVALCIGLSMGIGEGVFYGSREKTVRYAVIGAGISLVMGFVSGYVAQWMYATMMEDSSSAFLSSLIRGIGWAVMGGGIGLSVGLIRPEKKRIRFCMTGGLSGAFIGGFLFNYIYSAIPNDVVARAAGIVIMGCLIGAGVGLLEQIAKQAWLKVTRGEFEGKEYLVFAGTTSIGNNGKNTIVLFKDKLVAPHHCDIVLEGGSYVLMDCGTPMGTIVNGMKISRRVLKRGDTIAIGNSVLEFQMK